MHWYDGWSMGWMMLSVLIGLVLVVLALWAVVQAGFSRTTVEDSAEAILKRRYARGEIDREDYEERRQHVRKA
ncbi:MAG TPA: SHOCT domain-containing protein [Vicinamibacterales bacterium]|nr:SHOCT domain-containing protein [Vicinamibacterales bacterium]